MKMRELTENLLEEITKALAGIMNEAFCFGRVVYGA
jgi:hypothetical protein